LAAGLRPDPLGELTALPDHPAGLRGWAPQEGRVDQGRGRRRGKGKGEEKGKAGWKGMMKEKGDTG